MFILGGIFKKKIISFKTVFSFLAPPPKKKVLLKAKEINYIIFFPRGTSYLFSFLIIVFSLFSPLLSHSFPVFMIY